MLFAYQTGFWIAVIFVGAVCFLGGALWGIYHERREMRREHSRLKEILAAQGPRNGQRGTHRSTTARARVSSADMSRSRVPLQGKVSDEKGAE